MKVHLGLARPADAGASLATPAHLLRSVAKQEDNVKLYLGAMTNQAEGKQFDMLPKDRPLRLLVSYHYYKNADLDALFGLFKDIKTLDVFADSGAYSAMTGGEPIVASEYIAWAKRWEHWFTVIAGPDVVSDAQATATATEKMMGEGFTKPVLPCFHVGEDWAWLDHWVKKTDYIALGGMVPYTRQRKLLAGWLSKAFARIPKHVKVHGFGMTTWPLMLSFPWYSVDSSSWTSGFRYASLGLFDSKRQRMVTVNMRDKAATLRNASLLAQYGMRPTEIQSRTYDRDWLCGACIESWQRIEDYVTKKIHLVMNGVSGPPNSFKGIAAGVKIYLQSSATNSEKHVGSPAHILKGIQTVENDS